jgi:hypothetical protein
VTDQLLYRQSTPPYLIEENEQPWPAVAEDETTRRAVRETTERLLAGKPANSRA